MRVDVTRASTQNKRGEYDQEHWEVDFVQKKRLNIILINSSGIFSR